MNLPKRYSDVKDFKKIMFVYDSALKEVETKIEILNNEFKMTSEYNPIEHITSRIKTPKSIRQKLRNIQKEFTIENIVKYINDIAGIRIICSFRSDIFRIADAISRQNDIKVLKIKDYITNPKENGYSSYHMIVAVPIYLTNTVIETKVEIQIRTISMDYWASLEHKIYYKFEGNAPEHISKDLKKCANIVSYLDERMLAINEEVENYKTATNTKSDSKTFLKDNEKDSFGHVFEEDYIGGREVIYNQAEYILEDNQYTKESEEPREEDHNSKSNINISKKMKKNERKDKDSKDKNILSFFKLNY